ncbi:MAG: VOC family protein [Bacteroidetes bacterium]|nr:MAG: VOC family protein [Bacteroidota bacterium]
MLKYVHTNIITDDWQRLAQFYIDVFECKPLEPKRDLSGEWLEKGTAVPRAHLKGIHLALPGYDGKLPTLEIFQYEKNEERLPTLSNRKGFGHIAFLVDDVQKLVTKVLEHGGAMVGEIVEHEVPGVGLLTFAYVRDIDGNIIELQNWK